jgi:predicted enzyme related to lactoylglutathione lyase
MGPEMTYTILRLDGNDTGGVFQFGKQELAAHVPPHWMPYIKVANADTTAAKAVSLGAQQIVPPTDIPNVGRFALIQDPAGSHVSLYEPGQHRGFKNYGEVGTMCWADLNSTDPAKAAKFYSDCLGWTVDSGKDGYSHITNGTGHENMVGGMMKAPPGVPSHWLSYFHVADCKATAAKASQLGAKTLMPADLMPDVGTIAVLSDPQGAVFALYQPVAR